MRLTNLILKYRILWTRPARKDLENLEDKAREKIDEKLKELVMYVNGKNVEKPDLKILKGKYKGYKRLRVGNYRVIFQMQKCEFVILIVRVAHRKKVY